MAAVSDGGEVRHTQLHEVEVRAGRRGLSSQILAVAIASVLVAVGAAMAVAFPLVRSAAADQARQVLAQQADTLQSILLRGGGEGQGWQLPADEDGDEDDRPHRGRPGQLAPDVVVVAVTPSSQPVGPITAADIAAVVAGASVTAANEAAEGDYFIEGRPLASGTGFFLVQPNSAAEGPANVLLGRMALALLLGLAAAVGIALFVANRAARPLRAAALVAGELAAGHRQVELEVAGPREVAEIGRSLNLLAANLAGSEDRQREFLMSVSHELRTPMTALRGYSEALADGLIEPTEVPQVGELMTAEATRLDRLVSDLLDLARAQAVEFQLAMAPTDLGGIARAAAETWRMRCQQEGLQLQTDIAPDLPMVTADAIRVRQILDNLLENAVRVLPAGGTVRISALPADGVLLAVDDDGPGLAAADLEVAFQPAVLNSRYRGQRPVGTGLGLALVGKLAERMGAAAAADHSPMGGARFEVRFPRAN